MGWAIPNGYSIGDEKHQRELAESCLRVHLVATTRYQVDRAIRSYGVARQMCWSSSKAVLAERIDACEGNEVVLVLAQQEVL